MISNTSEMDEMIKKKINFKKSTLNPMAGRRPIFATLITNILWGTRDFLFKVTLEPASHEKRKEKQERKDRKDEGQK